MNSVFLHLQTCETKGTVFAAAYTQHNCGGTGIDSSSSHFCSKGRKRESTEESLVQAQRGHWPIAILKSKWENVLSSLIMSQGLGIIPHGAGSYPWELVSTLSHPSIFMKDGMHL